MDPMSNPICMHAPGSFIIGLLKTKNVKTPNADKQNYPFCKSKYWVKSLDTLIK